MLIGLIYTIGSEYVHVVLLGTWHYAGALMQSNGWPARAMEPEAYARAALRVTPGTNLGRYQRIAPLYDLLDWPFEQFRYRRIRPRLFAGMSGRVLDAGVGTGRNIIYYPPGAEIVGIDVSPAMLARAERRRHETSAVVELRQMEIADLNFADGAFDGAVASFLFCVLPEAQQLAALRELRRVVKPGRPIRLLDYVRPQAKARRLLSKIWDPWTFWAYGANFDHGTMNHLGDVGLEVVETRYVEGDLIRLLDLRTTKSSGPS